MPRLLTRGERAPLHAGVPAVVRRGLHALTFLGPIQRHVFVRIRSMVFHPSRAP